MKNMHKSSLRKKRISKASFVILVMLISLGGLSVSCRSVDTDIAEQSSFVKFTSSGNDFPLVAESGMASMLADSDEYAGVLRAIDDLQKDVERVTSKKPKVYLDQIPNSKHVVIIGTIGKSKLIDKLISEKKLDVSAIADKWEAYIITSIDNGLDGAENTLIIAGSDMRGTIFGIYELSSQIGVSPWYWWADVPVRQHAELYISEGVFADHPLVKYRGIFLNDEAPALTGWVIEKFGGFNHKFYEHLYELILRLKGNYLWPAMWGSAFYDDDTLSPQLANEYGIVIGTSHHEPLMRSHDEWRRYGEGIWNFEQNPENLHKFWSESIKERKDYEAIITVGMRGDGDHAMTEGTATALLEKIIEAQRQILKDETGKDPAEIPQVWALYKEVQDYYNKGMEVPEDITLLLCDDNWGNVRVLPKPGTPERSGGYGMYYHYDFVGGPVSYRWLNVSPISRTWEQMNMTYEHGVDRIWIVNVGDLKPMEFPIDFFLEHAWNPKRMTAERMHEFTTEWVEEQFGTQHAGDIAELITQYTRFNYRRTPEMLSSETYSLHNFREAETIVKEYNELLASAERIAGLLPDDYQDSYYQLVTHQIEACANLNDMYLASAKNQLYAMQGRASTNKMAERVKLLFENDKKIEEYYHQNIAGGKWNHFMEQTHIGYTSWNNPDKNFMPEVEQIKTPKEAGLGLMVEGSDKWWPDAKEAAALPEFDNYNQQELFIEVFNRGKSQLNYSLLAADSWVKLSKVEGKLNLDERIWVSIDWDKVPAENSSSSILVKADKGQEFTVLINISGIADDRLEGFSGFIEANGYVSIEAEHFSSKTETGNMHWQLISEFGRTLSGITVLPTTIPSVKPGGNSPYLEYDVYITNPGELNVKVHVAPSLNIYNDAGMQYATSFDNQDPIIYKIHEFDTIPDWEYPAYWNNSVTDNTRILSTAHKIKESGAHKLKLWMVTPGVVVEKIVIETKDIGDSYLGPPESYFKD